MHVAPEGTCWTIDYPITLYVKNNVVIISLPC